MFITFCQVAFVEILLWNEFIGFLKASSVYFFLIVHPHYLALYMFGDFSKCLCVWNSSFIALDNPEKFRWDLGA